MSPEDNRLLFESVERLNAAEPSKAGSSEAWNNPQTKSSYCGGFGGAPRLPA
jgi:hypothetical protein